MARDTILVVDDDPDLRQVLMMYLGDTLGWRVLEADGVESATDVLRVEIQRIAVIISDDRMGGYGRNGSDLFFQRSLDLHIHDIPFVLLSGTSEPQFLATAREFGMVPVRKPVRLNVLGALLDTLISTMPLPIPPTSSEQ